MTNYEIVMKLIGHVHPVGSTHFDDESFENLKELTELTDQLLNTIHKISEFKSQHQYSMKRAGEHCSKFLDSIGIQE
jgi:hypothetical protein